MTIWQQLGAFVYTGGNLGIDKLDRFKEIGGKWICLLIYNDDVVADANRKLFPGLKAQCAARGITLGGWFNGRGGDPIQDAREINSILHNLAIPLCILDLEAEYQYPQGEPNFMPLLVWKLRSGYSGEIGVSTNGMNNSMIWNGRTLDPPLSFYQLAIRCLPQWYSRWYVGDKLPQDQMAWLQRWGNLDDNFKDPHSKHTKFRGLPLSYVHPTLEVTGLEGSDLEREIEDCLVAQNFGLTKGISIYTLENMPDKDFGLLKRYRSLCL